MRAKKNAYLTVGVLNECYLNQRPMELQTDVAIGEASDSLPSLATKRAAVSTAAATGHTVALFFTGEVYGQISPSEGLTM